MEIPDRSMACAKFSLADYMIAASGIYEPQQKDRSGDQAASSQLRGEQPRTRRRASRDMKGGAPRRMSR